MSVLRTVPARMAVAVIAAATVIPAVGAPAHATPAPQAATRTVALAAAPAAKAAWKPSWSGTLRPGASGAHVRSAQQRLAALGYWSGTVDGKYGSLTSQAVMALQKATGLSRTGVLDQATTRALQRGVVPIARTKKGKAIEVDLKRQLLLVVKDGKVVTALNTSTGSGQVYYSRGVRSVAVTPKGTFRIERGVNALERAPLGTLYRPKYFYRGWAIHGSPSIPGYPASHGCARVSNAAMDFLWSSGATPIGRTVVIY